MVEYLDPGPWPGFIGDRREKFVRITLGSGEEIEYSEVFFFISAREFVVSKDESHNDTIRYDTDEVARVEVIQHHTACFITTAVAGNDEILESLRGFREDTMARTTVGRSLLWIYDHVSPPIARTLANNPNARFTNAIRWLIHKSAGLAKRREDRDSAFERRVLSLGLLVLYVIGILLAITSHVAATTASKLPPNLPKSTDIQDYDR